MKNKKETRGGLRHSNPGGRPKKAAKRVTVSVCLDPENLEYRKAVGRGWNDLVNRLVKNQTADLKNKSLIKNKPL